MNTVARSFLFGLFGLFGLFATFSSALIACGAASAESSAPALPAMEPEPKTVDEAQAQLDRARVELDRNIASTIPAEAAQPRVSAQPSPPPPPPVTPQSAPADAPPPSSNERATTSTTPRAPTPCEQACRALSSMRRAKDAICRMTSDADEKCTRATKVVGDAETRASSCGCPR